MSEIGKYYEQIRLKYGEEVAKMLVFLNPTNTYESKYRDKMCK